MSADRVIPCWRRDAILWRYDKSDPSQTLDGIVFHGHGWGNVTTVTFASGGAGKGNFPVRRLTNFRAPRLMPEDRRKS